MTKEEEAARLTQNEVDQLLAEMIKEYGQEYIDFMDEQLEEAQQEE